MEAAGLMPGVSPMTNREAPPGRGTSEVEVEVEGEARRIALASAPRLPGRA